LNIDENKKKYIPPPYLLLSSQFCQIEYKGFIKGWSLFTINIQASIKPSQAVDWVPLTLYFRVMRIPSKNMIPFRTQYLQNVEYSPFCTHWFNWLHIKIPNSISSTSISRMLISQMSISRISISQISISQTSISWTSIFQTNSFLFLSVAL